MTRKNPLVKLYGVLVVLVFSIVYAGQILGFIGFYKPIFVFPFVAILATLVGYLYFRENGKFYKPALFNDNNNVDSKTEYRAQILLYIISFTILILLICLPLIRWPYSIVNETLTWDAGLYHFPKAIELFRSGSSWDLSIPYGEYPFGYESLLSFGISITNNEALFGSVHAIIAVYFFLSLFFLLRRYTRLSGGWIAILVSILLISGREITSGNPWWIFNSLICTIGKNDLILGAALLASIFHAPVGLNKTQNAYHTVGLALNSMISVSIKPNSLIVIIPLWLIVGYRWFISNGEKVRISKIPWIEGILVFILVTPGFLWILRNYSVMHTIFSEGVMEVQNWSIANNLFNPFFYLYIPKNLILTFGIFFVCIVLAIWRKWFSWSFILIYTALFASFIFSPASAFLNNTQVPTEIAWRFSIGWLTFALLTLVMIFDKILQRIKNHIKGQQLIQICLLVLVTLISMGIIWRDRELTYYVPENMIVLEDQYRESVGINGYHSAIDYVHKNIRNSVIQVENAQLFYFYGRGYSNSPTKLDYPLGRANTVKQLDPEYFAIFQTPWFEGQQEGFPPNIDQPDWLNHWQLVYSDSQGRLYKKKN